MKWHHSSLLGSPCRLVNGHWYLEKVYSLHRQGISIPKRVEFCDFCAAEMEAASTCETSVTIYQLARCHITEEFNFYEQRRKDFKSRTELCSWKYYRPTPYTRDSGLRIGIEHELNSTLLLSTICYCLLSVHFTQMYVVSFGVSFFLSADI